MPVMNSMMTYSSMKNKSCNLFHKSPIINSMRKKSYNLKHRALVNSIKLMNTGKIKFKLLNVPFKRNACYFGLLLTL